MDKKRYTIRDIALACGVSTATVSYVLNDVKNQSISAETKNRILHYAHLVGYASSSSARALATGHSNAVGIYLPEGGDSRCRLLLLHALTSELEASGMAAQLLTQQCLHRTVTDVDAVFAVGVTVKEFRAIGENSFVPLLCLDGRIDDDLFYSVYFDAAALRARAQALSGSRHIFLAAEPARNENYRAHLAESFDRCLSEEEALFSSPQGDSVVLTWQPLLAEAIRAQGGKAYCLGSGEFPLPYDAYAGRTIAIMKAAILRDSTPAEHDVPIR